MVEKVVAHGAQGDGRRGEGRVEGGVDSWGLDSGGATLAFWSEEQRRRRG